MLKKTQKNRLAMKRDFSKAADYASERKKRVMATKKIYFD
jgi:hypothetical protein